MRTLKTLKQALRLQNDGRLTAQDLLRGQLYTTRGWEYFKLDSQFKEELARAVSNALGGHNKTKEKVYNLIRWGSPSHWGLARVMITRRKDPKDKRRKLIRVDYCAGQDYIFDLNEIRKDLRNM